VAQFPYFVLGANGWVGVPGSLRGGNQIPRTVNEDWRQATIDVVILALDARENIVRCLASVMRQTLRPRHIVLIDDGSTDDTSERAHAFCEFRGVNLALIRRFQSIGKTKTLKEQASELDSDVLFVLDADTVLETENYIERTVHDLYQGAGIVSACGGIRPLRETDQLAADESPCIRSFMDACPLFDAPADQGRLRRLVKEIVDVYREVICRLVQCFVARGQMVLFGTVADPAGRAVAYRRRYLELLFDYFEPRPGGSPTNSEDIFIGLAALGAGYRNVYVTDVLARTREIDVHRLPKQLHLWLSACFRSTSKQRP
jgi:glycosyltransferase involved in cell wall biosynthesis